MCFLYFLIVGLGIWSWIVSVLLIRPIRVLIIITITAVIDNVNNVVTRYQFVLNFFNTGQYCTELRIITTIHAGNEMLHRETWVAGILNHTIHILVKEADVYLEIAQDRQIMCFAHQVLAALAFGISLFNLILNQRNLSVSFRHF